MRVVLKVRQLLDRKGMTQKELSQLTGIRESTISDICRQSRTVVNLTHLEKIMEALNITDIRLVMEVK